MSNVIKRRHTVQYAQIHNNPLQNDLEDLRAIGLLSHLMSLPSDWVIYKTQLYRKFSRKNVDAAWKELASKNYIIGFHCYVDGKKNSFYNVSDVPFISEEYSEFVSETISVLTKSGSVVKSPSPMDGLTLDITGVFTNAPKAHQSEISGDFTNVPRVQYSQYSTEGTYTKEIYTKEILTNDDDDIPNVSLSDDNQPSIEDVQKEMHTPNLTDDDLFWISDNIRNAYKGKIQKRSFDSILKKCIINYKKGTVPHFENYLITSIDNKITELEERREREKSLLDLTPKTKSRQQKSARKEIVPEWLREQQQAAQEVASTVNSFVDVEAERKLLEEELKKYKRA